MQKKILLLLLLALPLLARAKDNDEFFARVTAGNDNEITVGDSTVFTVWLYATKPFGEVTSTSPKVKIGGCHVRLTYQAANSRQSITYLKGKPYYCAAWAQYVIGSDKKGSYTFPALTLQASLYIEQQQQGDPFDPFGFFAQPVYKKIKKSTNSDALKFNVVNAPLKSTEELMKSGKTVI